MATEVVVLLVLVVLVVVVVVVASFTVINCICEVRASNLTEKTDLI